MDLSPASTTNTFLKYYTYALYFIIISAYIGIGITQPKWMTGFDYYLKIFISIFLLYRFNSFRNKISFEELDRRIAFSAGLLLFTSTVANELLFLFSPKYRTQIEEKIAIKNIAIKNNK